MSAENPQDGIKRGIAYLDLLRAQRGEPPYVDKNDHGEEPIVADDEDIVDPKAQGETDNAA
jgi:hypothetical protein